MSLLSFLHPLWKRSLNEYDDSVNSAVIGALNQSLSKSEEDMVQSKVESYLSTADAKWLDYWGYWFGERRKSGWSDDYYRSRIVNHVEHARGTVDALRDAIADFINTNKDNIYIYEPYRDMFIWNSSKYNTNKYFSSTYYRYAVIDIQISASYPKEIVSIINLFRPAGVLWVLTETVNSRNSDAPIIDIKNPKDVFVPKIENDFIFGLRTRTRLVINPSKDDYETVANPFTYNKKDSLFNDRNSLFMGATQISKRYSFVGQSLFDYTPKDNDTLEDSSYNVEQLSSSDITSVSTKNGRGKMFDFNPAKNNLISNASQYLTPITISSYSQLYDMPSSYLNPGSSYNFAVNINADKDYTNTSADLIIDGGTDNIAIGTINSYTVVGNSLTNQSATAYKFAYSISAGTTITLAMDIVSSTSNGTFKLVFPEISNVGGHWEALTQSAPLSTTIQHVVKTYKVSNSQVAINLQLDNADGVVKMSNLIISKSESEPTYQQSSYDVANENLLQGTRTQSDTNYWSVVNNSNNSGTFLGTNIYNTVKDWSNSKYSFNSLLSRGIVNLDDDYTYSEYVRVTGVDPADLVSSSPSNSQFSFYSVATNKNATPFSMASMQKDVWYRLSVTFKFTTLSASSGDTALRFESRMPTTAGSFQFAAPKLEKGTNATPFSFSPYDPDIDRNLLVNYDSLSEYPGLNGDYNVAGALSMASEGEVNVVNHADSAGEIFYIFNNIDTPINLYGLEAGNTYILSGKLKGNMNPSSTVNARAQYKTSPTSSWLNAPSETLTLTDDYQPFSVKVLIPDGSVYFYFSISATAPRAGDYFQFKDTKFLPDETLSLPSDDKQIKQNLAAIVHSGSKWLTTQFSIPEDFSTNIDPYIKFSGIDSSLALKLSKPIIKSTANTNPISWAQSADEETNTPTKLADAIDLKGFINDNYKTLSTTVTNKELNDLFDTKKLHLVIKTVNSPSGSLTIRFFNFNTNLWVTYGNFEVIGSYTDIFVKLDDITPLMNENALMYISIEFSNNKSIYVNLDYIGLSLSNSEDGYSIKMFADQSSYGIETEVAMGPFIISKSSVSRAYISPSRYKIGDPEYGKIGHYPLA